MSDKDDPFGLSNDAGRTRIRPMRAPQAAVVAANRPPEPAMASAPPHSGGYGRETFGTEPSSKSVRLRNARAHPNPLVAAYATLLEIAPERVEVT